MKKFIAIILLLSSFSIPVLSSVSANEKSSDRLSYISKFERILADIDFINRYKKSDFKKLAKDKNKHFFKYMGIISRSANLSKEYLKLIAKLKKNMDDIEKFQRFCDSDKECNDYMSSAFAVELGSQKTKITI